MSGGEGSGASHAVPSARGDAVWPGMFCSCGPKFKGILWIRVRVLPRGRGVRCACAAERDSLGVGSSAGEAAPTARSSMRVAARGWSTSVVPYSPGL